MAVTRAKDSEIKAAFQKFDKDNSGSLEIGELYDVLREIGLEITKEHFDGYSQIMMDDFDTDKSGALDYDEFTRFYEQVLVNESGKGQYKEMLELKEEGNTFFPLGRLPQGGRDVHQGDQGCRRSRHREVSPKHRSTRVPNPIPAHTRPPPPRPERVKYLSN